MTGIKRLFVSAAVFTVATALGMPTASATTSSGPPYAEMVWSHFTDDFSAAQIVRGDADTKHVHALTHFADGRYDLEAGLSPNHKQVVFQRSFPDDTAGIGYVDTAGKHEHILNLHCTDPCVEDDDPTWSRDDQHIVFTRVFGPFDPNHNNNAASAVLWTSDLSGQHLRRLSEPGIDGKFEDYRAQFGPGGWATFIRVRNSDGKTAIFAMKAAGGHAHQLTPWDIEAGGPDLSPATHGPSAGLVTFETFTHGSPPGKTQAVGTVPVDCTSLQDCKSKLRLLTELNTDTEANYAPCWLPDGRTIVFGHATLEIPGDLWRMDWNGHHVQQLDDTPELELGSDAGSTG